MRSPGAVIPDLANGEIAAAELVEWEDLTTEIVDLVITVANAVDTDRLTAMARGALVRLHQRGIHPAELHAIVDSIT